MKTIILWSVLFLSSCGYLIDNDNTVSAVQKQGYRNVKIEDKSVWFNSWRGCGQEDRATYEISATNALGQPVRLIACVGWPFKGVTIRTE
jgi:hypothetical protein